MEVYTKINWHTEKRKVRDLIPYEGNPRQMTEQQANNLKESIIQYDLAEIPAINTNNVICAGHMRIKALIELGKIDDTIDVRVPNRELTQEEFEGYLLRSNLNIGEWNFDMLANFSEEKLQEVGFDSVEIDHIFSQHGTIVPDNIPEVSINTDIKFGDKFKLGEHILFCGDSSNENDVKNLMQNDLIDMIFTDPPYGVDYGLKNRHLQSIEAHNRILTNIKNDNLKPKELINLLQKVFTLALKYSQDYCSYYITCFQGGDVGYEILNAMKSCGLPIRHTLIWVKNVRNFSFCRLDYEYQHEPILYTWNKRRKFYGGGQFKSTTWFIDKQDNKLHPTMKPVELIENALLNSSKRDDIIADFFTGSGSTIIACERLSRRCRAMEIEPYYAEICCKRWEEYTGERRIKL